MTSVWLRFAVALAGLVLQAVALAALPPITDADWAAKAPATDPNAGIVVLYERGEFSLLDPVRPSKGVSSTLRVEGRIKVLAPHGLEQSVVEIGHSRYMRLQSISARTLLPDGRVLPVPADAKLRTAVSERRKRWVTAVVFPGVEVGSILEYEAEFRFDYIFFLEAWSFSATAPVLYSEVVFIVPTDLQAATWIRDAFNVGLRNEQSGSVHGTLLRYWARDLPAVPVEPYAAPFADLATQLGLIITAYSDNAQLNRLQEDWRSSCRLLEDWQYRDARRKNGGVRERAKGLVGGVTDPRQKAEAVYRFVRDEVRTERLPGITLEAGNSAEQVLADRSGTYAEKALLLEALLDAAGVRSRLVWANDRTTGLALLDVADPGWFERVVVAAELPTGRVYLDAGEPGMPFGWLPAELENGQAVIVDVKKPELVTLPAAPPEANRRSAVLRLAVDEDGRAAGTGELRLSGHHALKALAESDASRLAETWKPWLEERLPGFRVDGLAAEVGEGDVRLSWTLEQRAEEVLGDELLLTPSRPLGPLTQIFTLPPKLRRTPVVLPFGERVDVDLELTFPAGWRLEGLPDDKAFVNGAGGFSASLAVDETAHRLAYRRRLDVTLRETRTSEAYQQLQELWAAAEAHDAQVLALARR